VARRQPPPPPKKKTSRSTALSNVGDSPTSPTEAADLQPPAVSDEAIDEAYEELRQVQRDATLTLAIKMGQIIVTRLYGGSLEAWRRHGPKESSLRKLAKKFEADGSGTSASTLSRAVGIYDLEQRVGVSARKQLTVTHVRAVLGLPEDQQEKLLDKAEATGWSTRKMEDQARRARQRLARGRGRPALPPVVKSSRQLRRVTTDTRKELAGGVGTLSEDQLGELRETIQATRALCDQLAEVLDGAEPSEE